ncbi:MAG TPA: sensor histidine kinase [Rhizomicrobium sp.]
MDPILEFELRTPIAPPLDTVAEANHRIANSLALVVGMVRMQAVSVKKNPVPMTNAEVRVLLDGIAARINTIAQLHRLLSYTAADGVISLRPHLQEITDALVAALSSPEQMVRVVHVGSDCMMQMRQVQPVILILCEIFINAVKYAHPAGVPLVMTVDCSVGGDGLLALTISDDGVGLPEGYDPLQAKGMGFRVMRSLATEIGADLQMQSTHLGLTTRLSLPASAMTGAKLA